MYIQQMYVHFNLKANYFKKNSLKVLTFQIIHQPNLWYITL
jgi:hypothetical protein